MSKTYSRQEAAEMIAGWDHWYHQIEIMPGLVTPGINASAACARLLPIPENCEGLRVLDLGARDGYFSFELEKRGAEVHAIDYLPVTQTGFGIARELVGSNVSFEVKNVYDISPESMGQFDLVLFLGLLYHLRNPMLALDRIWAVTKDGGQLIVESQVADEAFMAPEDGQLIKTDAVSPRLKNSPIMQFCPAGSLNNDWSNWWVPNMVCLRNMLEMAGFELDYERLNAARGIFGGRKIVNSQINRYRDLDCGTVA